jgi:hypothetical protein
MPPALMTYADKESLAMAAGIITAFVIGAYIIYILRFRIK